MSNPDPTTPWLTESAGADQIPYPISNIPLNWPNIDVPLLILPAKATVNGTDKYSEMYYIQCQKYLAKCANANKQMVMMDGDHGFVLEKP